jgi:Uma2 family endonuclease
MLAPAPVFKPAIIYPESDGRPMADNTKQFDYITSIKHGFDKLFATSPTVFVAGDLLWYPVEGNPCIAAAPDVMVVFGRPKGDRRSYLQWEEDNIPPHVVFEILSHNNRTSEMVNKFRFYERHGVEEYYLFNPENGEFAVWTRNDDTLQSIEEPLGWTSPRLDVRFEVEHGDLVLYEPNGERFLTYMELVEKSNAESRRAEAESRRAEAESRRAEQERKQREKAEQHAAVLAEKLRQVGIDPDTLS